MTEEDELQSAYEVVGEMLEYFDGYKLATWAPLAAIILRERRAKPTPVSGTDAVEVTQAERRWCFDLNAAPEGQELLVYRSDNPMPWDYGVRAIASKEEGEWYGADGDPITVPACWTTLAEKPLPCGTPRAAIQSLSTRTEELVKALEKIAGTESSGASSAHGAAASLCRTLNAIRDIATTALASHRGEGECR